MNSTTVVMKSITVRFEEATRHVSSGKLEGVSQEKQLELYGLYSVVKKGPAPSQAPSSLLDPVGFAKRTAWQQVSCMSKDDAMNMYVQLVSNLSTAPGPSPESGLVFGNRASAGFDISAPDGEEFSDNENDISYWSAMGDISAVCQCLSQKGISPNQRDQDGLTPLMRAVDRNHHEVVEVLVASGAELNAVDEEGQTALHYAVQCDHSEMVALLVYHGARTDIIDSYGVEALAPASDNTKSLVDDVKAGKWKRKCTSIDKPAWFLRFSSPTIPIISPEVFFASAFLVVGVIAYYRCRN